MNIFRKSVVRFAATAVLLCGLSALYGAEVSSADAARAAKTWVDMGRSMGKIPSGRDVSSVEAIEDSATGARLLVAKFDGGGFVVLSADDLVDPVISFSATGDGVNTDESNPYWALLRGDIAAREAAAGIVRGASAPSSRLLSTGTATNTASQRKWAELLGSSGRARLLSASTTPSDIRVDSFVESRWNQSTHNNYSNGKKCYNYYTPNNYVCGCVATAGAQVMRYWQYPTTYVTAKTFECSVSGTSADYTMRGGYYEWDSMPLVPAGGVTDAQCQAIGKLTYDVGVSVGMDWASDGSGSPGYDLALRLPDTFDYANAVPAWYINGYYEYSLDEVKKVVIPNCDARAPMVMSVSGAGGHAVLVDGYGYSGDDFYMHVNMGWGGSSDAWYCPPNIEDFTAIDGFVFNIFPDVTGSILSGRVLDSSSNPVSGATVSLKSGSTTVATTSTDSNGIYSFVVGEGSYVLHAQSGGVSAYSDASVSETVGTSLTGTGSYYYSTAVIGNSYGNDITLTGMAAVEPPVFDPESCLFYPSTNVTITCSTAGATIRYTLDGTTPTETSTVYTGPIFVDDTTTIKARAFATGSNPSATASATYTYNAAAGAPKGDYFDNPINISGESGTRVIDDNADYTIEDGEPLHTLKNSGYYSQYGSAWYEWTAPGSGTITFNTSCRKITTSGNTTYTTRIPTYIAVYTGNTLSSIQRIAFSTTLDSNYVTSLSISVEQGVTYRIVGVMGYDGSGTFTLTWSGDLAVQQSPYDAWATENGLGEPEEVRAGVANVFRYVFDKPSESFSAITSVGFDSSGRVVITLPTIVNTDGVTLTLLSTTDISDWTSSSVEERAVSVGADGTLTFTDDDPARFYRLKATLAE